MMTDDKYLALDIGQARIGLAVGSTIPFGRGAIEAGDPQLVLARLREIIDRETITGLVIGVPLTVRGEKTAVNKLIASWLARLRAAFPDLLIATVDEAYTSRAAEWELRQHGVKTEKDKGRVDERAAELILAQFLAEKP